MNREKIIKGLECCEYKNKLHCDQCPYDYNGRGNERYECTAELSADALVLLKEQESKQVLSLADSVGEMTVGYCPSCGKGIANKLSIPTKFCRYCGQEVKWE